MNRWLGWLALFAVASGPALMITLSTCSASGYKDLAQWPYWIFLLLVGSWALFSFAFYHYVKR